MGAPDTLAQIAIYQPMMTAGLAAGDVAHLRRKYPQVPLFVSIPLEYYELYRLRRQWRRACKSRAPEVACGTSWAALSC